jgi:hypothetical protein
VTIKGTRFASPANVTIGSAAGEVDVVSADEIKARTAATALGSDEVVVADANGTSSHGPTYSYLPPPPSVSSIEPNSGPNAGGTEVTINGSEFKAGATVHFGAKSASSVTVSSASQIKATSPAGTGTVNVTVTASTGTSEEGSADRFSYIPPDQTNGLDLGFYCQTLGYEGATLAREAVTGPDFAYENWACVKSGGGLVTIAAAGPAPSMDNACVVENPGVAVYAYPTEEDNAFTWGCYLLLPAVTSIEPTGGTPAGGTAVKIKGSGFLAGATVKIGNAATSVDVVSETEITAKTPATAAGPDEVVVTDVNGTSTGGPSYTYGTAPTVVTEPASGVSNSAATLKASVNPNGAPITACELEYGTSVAYGSSVPCSPSPGSGTSAVAVSGVAGRLNGSTTYHFRISATNAVGTSVGADQTFTTLSSPHWQRNGTKAKEGEKLGTIAWGTVTLEDTAGTVTCKTASAANIEDTTTAARDETELFATYECKAVGGECVAKSGETRVGAQGLPWLGAIVEEGEGSEEFRQETSSVALNVECYKAGVLSEHTLFKSGSSGTETGTWTPKWLNGTTAAKPSEAVFDTKGGHLLSETGGLKLTPKGKLKTEGFEGSPVPLLTLGPKSAP